jgi:hypothetical protein
MKRIMDCRVKPGNDCGEGVRVNNYRKLALILSSAA